MYGGKDRAKNQTNKSTTTIWLKKTEERDERDDGWQREDEG